MESRTFELGKVVDLPTAVKMVCVSHEIVARDDKFLGSQYQNILTGKSLSEVIKNLFFEKVNPNQEDRFINAVRSASYERFSYVYKKIGRLGCRSMTTCLANNIEII